MARPRKIDQLTESRDDVCEERIVHMDAVRVARATLPPVEQVGALSGVFSVLADPTRLRIIASLREGELCVCDLAAVVGQSESAVSHQLRVLRQHNLVRSRKDGRRKYYALDDRHVAGLFGLALEHVAHEGRSS
jgi:ArsR family transcriptional regulator, lead/cadmium/zinc/bismuth-responsive transcriptional repressor